MEVSAVSELALLAAVLQRLYADIRASLGCFRPVACPRVPKVLRAAGVTHPYRVYDVRHVPLTLNAVEYAPRDCGACSRLRRAVPRGPRPPLTGDARSFQARDAYSQPARADASGSNASNTPPPRPTAGPLKHSVTIAQVDRCSSGPASDSRAFRLAVLDAYDQQCAVATEHSLAIIDAAHIRPWVDGGTHEIRNGIPLRRDLHRLFDLG